MYIHVLLLVVHASIHSYIGRSCLICNNVTISKIFNQFEHFLSLQEMIEKFNPYFLVINIFLLCVYTSEPSHRWFYLLLLDPILL